MKKNKWGNSKRVFFAVFLIIATFGIAMIKEAIDQKDIETQQNAETHINQSGNKQNKSSESSIKMHLLDYVSQYSQVVKNHFYFLRESSRNKYVLYQDQAKEILSFSMRDGELRGFAIYHSQYFVLICTETGTLQLGVVDRNAKEIDILCSVYARKNIDCIILYQDCLYICESEEKKD